MNLRIPLLFFTISLLSSCATFDRTSQTWKEQEIFLNDFIGAKKNLNSNANSSCETLHILAEKQNFILRDFAQLYWVTRCEEARFIPIGKEFVANKPWLQELYSEYLYQEAFRTQDPEKLATSYIEKAKISNKLKEKADLSIAAYQFAKKTQNEKLIREAEERMYRAAPRLQQNPDEKEWLRVGQDLLLQRDFQLARKYFQKIVDQPQFTQDEKYQAFRLIRNSYKIEQNKIHYIQESKKLVTWLQKTGNYLRLHEAYLTQARAEWTEGKLKEAKKTLAKATKELRGKFPLDEIYWIYGRMDEEAGDFQKAIENYKIAENESKEKTGLKEKILNQKAWVLRKIGRYEESAIHFAELQRMSEDPFSIPRYQFWEARNWQSAGQQEAAQALYKKLTQDDPIGYYGLLAYQQQGQLLPPLPIESTMTPNPNTSYKLDIQTQTMIRALSLADEKFALEKFIQNQIPNPQKSNFDEKTTFFILSNMAEVGLYQPLLTYLNTMPQETKNKILLSHPELVFPRRYLELIESSARKFNVEKELVLSIIRQESSFDPMARSAADAFGLMQLLPSVAKQHEDRTGISLDHYEDLFLPEKNIPFGTALLADLQKKYRNQFILTAAAYNANEKAIATWIKTRYRDDTLEFIEDIPYDETRRYVKLVMRNYIFYRRLQNPSKPIQFPGECLDLRSARSMTDSSSVSM